MIYLQSTTEGQWIHRKSLNLTDEQKTLIGSNDPADMESKRTLMVELQSQMNEPATSELAAIAEAKYMENKPVLEPDQTYQLIDVGMNIDGQVASGIINCRIDGEHKQYRF